MLLSGIICVRPSSHVPGGALILLATLFALGSEWALPWALAAVACLAWRLVEEERYLSRHLPGYDAYRQQTPFRLIPYVW
jgi:protein-S-isoprenylcysteine O-methyltransferase Ste14